MSLETAFSVLFLLTHVKIKLFSYISFIGTCEVFQVSFLSILILVAFLSKWIENEVCDILWY